MWQIDNCRCPCELVFPILQRGVESRTGQTSALPSGIIGILERQGREGRGKISGADVRLCDRSAIQEVQLLLENSHRPSIGDNVVNDDEQDVMVIPRTEEMVAP